MAAIIVLFWIVGVVSGLISAFFFLSLENKYIYQPANMLVAHVGRGFSLLYSRTTVSFRKMVR
jgi:hypothetical protein